MVEIGLERLIYLGVLLLGLLLVLPEIVLLLEIGPDCHFIDEVAEQVICLLLGQSESLLLIDPLQLMLIQVDQKAIRVGKLRH